LRWEGGGGDRWNPSTKKELFQQKGKRKEEIKRRVKNGDPEEESDLPKTNKRCDPWEKNLREK